MHVFGKARQGDAPVDPDETPSPPEPTAGAGGRHSIRGYAAILPARHLHFYPRPADPGQIFFDMVLAPVLPSTLDVDFLGLPSPLAATAVEGELDRAGPHVESHLLVQSFVCRGPLPREDIKEASHGLSAKGVTREQVLLGLTRLATCWRASAGRPIALKDRNDNSVTAHSLSIVGVDTKVGHSGRNVSYPG